MLFFFMFPIDKISKEYGGCGADISCLHGIQQVTALCSGLRFNFLISAHCCVTAS